MKHKYCKIFGFVVLGSALCAPSLQAKGHQNTGASCSVKKSTERIAAKCCCWGAKAVDSTSLQSIGDRIDEARRLRRAGELVESKRILFDVVDADQHGEAYLQLAACFFSENRLEQARFYTEKALKIDPLNGNALYNLSTILYSEDSTPRGGSNARRYYLSAVKLGQRRDLEFEKVIFMQEEEEEVVVAPQPRNKRGRVGMRKVRSRPDRSHQ